MEKIQVSHYGFHRDAQGITWLHQTGSTLMEGANALGRSIKSPFKVVLPLKGVMCNHLIPLANPLPDVAHWNVYQKLMDDPAVKLIEPRKDLPPGAHFFTDPRGQLTLHFVVLSRLTSPIRPIVIPVGMTSKKAIINELAVTNCQPLIITGLTTDHALMIEDISQAALTSPRRLILLGEEGIPLPPTVTRQKTSVHEWPIEDIAALNWESVGAVIAKRYMRGEERCFDLEAHIKMRVERKKAKPAYLK